MTDPCLLHEDDTRVVSPFQTSAHGALLNQ